MVNKFRHINPQAFPKRLHIIVTRDGNQNPADDINSNLNKSSENHYYFTESLYGYKICKWGREDINKEENEKQKDKEKVQQEEEQEEQKESDPDNDNEELDPDYEFKEEEKQEKKEDKKERKYSEVKEVKDVEALEDIESFDDDDDDEKEKNNLISLRYFKRKQSYNAKSIKRRLKVSKKI